MGQRRGVFGDGLTRLIDALTASRTVASEALGREGWLRVEVECESAAPSRWIQIALEFSTAATLSKPGREGLFLHPFALTLACNGEPVEEWNDALSAHWDSAALRAQPDHRRGQGGELLRVSGRLALVDVRLPPAGVLEIHLKLPWHDRDKREGFEADSHLERAVLRVSTLGAIGRALRAPGLERVLIGA